MKPFLILVTILLGFAALGGNVLFAHAALETTGDNCAVTWKNVDVPQVGNLHAVAAISPSNVWVAGDGDMLRWNGQTWATIPNPIGQPIGRLAGLPDGDIWASNQDTVMHWNQTKWEQVGDKVDFGTGSDLAVLASDNIWATTSDGVMHWDGSQWTYMPITDVESQAFFTHISALAADKLWVVGYYGHVRTAVVYSWNGAQWNQEPVGLNGESVYQSSSASAFDNVWIIGREGSQAVQRFDGTNWVRHDPTNNYLNDINALAPDNVYGVSGQILHWDGNAWSVLFTSNVNLEAISASSATDLWAVGGSRVMHGTLPCAAPLTPTPTTAPPPTPKPCAVTSPELIVPQNQARITTNPARLTWQGQVCANTYRVVLRVGSTKNIKVAHEELTKPRYRTATLANGLIYYWHVRACNAVRCSKWSEWRSFKINS